MKRSTKTAYEVVLDQLSRRDRSLSELEATLARKGYAPEEVTQALKRVVELGYLNEDRLASSVIRDTKSAGRGPRHAWLKLKRKGVEGWPLERVTEAWRSEGGEEFEAARAFALRRYPRAAEDPREARRALGALVRRGFSYETALKALKTSAKGEGGEEPCVDSDPSC